MTGRTQLVTASNSGRERRPGRGGREARAHRILDAAAALVMRWGYNKTTIDDIARQAGVAKGTIYLHWPTREALFSALMQRERLAWTADVLRRVTNDPSGATLHGLFKHSALALSQRPLLKAVLLRDMDIVGRLSHEQPNSAALADRIAAFTEYFEFLRQHQLVRSDIPMHHQLYMLAAIFMGYFAVAPVMPETLGLSNQVVAELLSETIRRTFEDPDRTLTPTELRTVAQRFVAYLERDRAIVETQFSTGVQDATP
jgi:AcrR family transcriptional regulator